MKDDGDTAAFDVNFYEIAFSSLIIFTTTLPQKKKQKNCQIRGFVVVVVERLICSQTILCMEINDEKKNQSSDSHKVANEQFRKDGWFIHGNP